MKVDLDVFARFVNRLDLTDMSDLFSCAQADAAERENLNRYAPARPVYTNWIAAGQII